MSNVNHSFLFRRKFSLNKLTQALLVPMFFGSITLPAYAQESDEATKESEDTTAQLGEIVVIENIFGKSINSHIVKDAKKLEKQQVNEIRDLVRYDPGLAVTEQGRGSSSGFAIRGVDKNRVAITVDGLPQAQSHLTFTSTEWAFDIGDGIGSGARNETEIENIGSVEFTKGGDGAKTGNGALGGSVNFRTKNVSDFLEENEKFATNVKLGYTGKNQQFMQSVGTAFNTGTFSGLYQFTNRDGKETSVHSNYNNKTYSVQKLGAYKEKYYLRGIPDELTGAEEPKDSGRKSVFHNGRNRLFAQCENCEPTYPAQLTQYYTLDEAISRVVGDGFERYFYPGKYTGDNKLTENEINQLKQMIHPTELLSAKDYTGYDRESPNPLDYKSASHLARLNWHITPNQTIGTVLEHTRQTYDMRDMTQAAYYLPPPRRPDAPYMEKPIEPSKWDNKYYDDNFKFKQSEYDKDLGAFGAKMAEYVANDANNKAWEKWKKDVRHYDDDYMKVRYATQNSSAGVYRNDKEMVVSRFAPALWTNTAFSYEVHDKARVGLNYAIQLNNSFVDNIEVHADWQKIKVDAEYNKLKCAPYPYADKNCRAGGDKPGSSEDTQKVKYLENHERLGFKYNKTFDFNNVFYRLDLGLGVARYGAQQRRNFRKLRYGGLNVISRPDKVDYISSSPSKLDETVILDHVDCAKPKDKQNDSKKDVEGMVCAFDIDGNNLYASINNHISFGEKIDLGVGVRKDIDRVLGKKDHVFDIVPRQHNHLSYNINGVFRPVDYAQFGYSYSTGFRNPSYAEIFGVSRDLATDYLKPETSTTQEFSMALQKDYGYVEASYFTSHYRNLISPAIISRVFHNPNAPINQPSNIRKYFKTHVNYSNAMIEGYGVRGYLDLHRLTDRAPNGLSVNAAYEITKPLFAKRVELEAQGGRLFPFDVISPARVVVGVDYNAPNKAWGSSVNTTYAFAKDLSELIQEVHLPATVKSEQVGELRSNPWTTVDLHGFYNIRKNITVNFGVNNLLNTEYATWESVRQNSKEAVHPERQVDPRDYYSKPLIPGVARYTAPGRNYYLSVKMKF